MVLTVDELLELLRSAVNISNEEAGVEDSGYLNMTDEELTTFLKLSISKVYPSAEDFDDLPPGSAYPIVLIAKKELYLKLAVLKANLIDLTADNNNQLKQSQRFSHYMALAENAQEEYEDWVENGGGATVDTVGEGATLVLSTLNFRNTNKKVTGLKPDTQYYLAVISVERNQLFGYKQVTFTTLSEMSGEEIDIEYIGGGGYE